MVSIVQSRILYKLYEKTAMLAAFGITAKLTVKKIIHLKLIRVKVYSQPMSAPSEHACNRMAYITY
jgi:hypothetical protein